MRVSSHRPPAPRHSQTCASQCTNFNGKDNTGPCEFRREHWCDWCLQGTLTYKQYQRWRRQDIQRRWNLRRMHTQ